MKILETLSAAAILLLASCANSGKVAYTEAKNYFHKNDAPLPESIRITSQEEFDRQFGMAAHMGKDGRPTAIDFGKEFVLTKVLPETNLETELTPLSLTREDGKLQLTYRLVQGKPQSYTSQPMFILIVPKAYMNLDVEEKVMK